MKARQFTPEAEALLQRTLDSTPDDARIAAFDADGTLWSWDATESLLDWLDRRGRIPRPPGAARVLDPYYAMVAEDKGRGYRYGAQLFAGLELGELLELSEQHFVEEMAAREFTEMTALVERFRRARFRVLIVSASPWWSLDPAMRRLGIGRSDVLAVELEIESTGHVSNRVIEPFTSGEGKVLRLRRELGAEGAPAFAAGNSLDDVPMLLMSTHGALVVDPPAPSSRGDLAALAQQRGWALHRTTAG